MQFIFIVKRVIVMRSAHKFYCNFYGVCCNKWNLAKKFKSSKQKKNAVADTGDSYFDLLYMQVHVTFSYRTAAIGP